VELAAPSAMMGVLGDAKLSELASAADILIEKALSNV
jgi:hypothetical protein